jgi:hypothetical protein
VFKKTILAVAAVAALSAFGVTAFANVPQSLVPTSESDNNQTAALDNVPQSLVPTSESDNDKVAALDNVPQSLVPTSESDSATA